MSYLGKHSGSSIILSSFSWLMSSLRVKVWAQEQDFLNLISDSATKTLPKGAVFYLPHLQEGNNNPTCFIGLYREDKINMIKEDLVHIKDLNNVSYTITILEVLLYFVCLLM